MTGRQQNLNVNVNVTVSVTVVLSSIKHWHTFAYLSIHLQVSNDH